MNKYKANPSFRLNAVEFIIWSAPFTNEEVGEMFRDICEACKKDDIQYLNQFPFIDKVFAGTQKYPSLSSATRYKVLRKGYCVHCGSTENLTVDHIKPQSKGGTHNPTNLQCLCFDCNRAKSDKYNG